MPEFLRALDHPLKSEVEALRKLILGAHPDIREEIKWNAPSFLTSEHFATFNLRERDEIRLVLHTGARAKGGRVEVADPAGLVKWLGPNRGLVSFSDAAAVRAKKSALQKLVREWIAQL